MHPPFSGLLDYAIDLLDPLYLYTFRRSNVCAN